MRYLQVTHYLYRWIFSQPFDIEWLLIRSDVSTHAYSSSSLSSIWRVLRSCRSTRDGVSKTHTFLCCWLVLSLNTLCRLIRNMFYIRWPLHPIYVLKLSMGLFRRSEEKGNSCDYVTILWITIPFHLAIQWIQAQLHRILYMKHPKNTFNIHSCKTFETLLMFSTCLHSLKNH